MGATEEEQGPLQTVQLNLESPREGLKHLPRPASHAAAAGAPAEAQPADAATTAVTTAATSVEGILAKRRAYLGPNVALFYKEAPLHIVAASGCLLFDESGADYLDCINNVSHVGHCHPKVARAVSSALASLNTNSRYLHRGLVDYAEALQATMPDPLQVCYMVCSGSEANDLAWRLACAAARSDGWAGALHAVVMDHAYHGHTSATIDLSPYKFAGPGGAGRPAHVHVLPCPDAYRGTGLDGGAAARAALAAAEAAGARVAAFFCESIISCGGQVMLPEGYLAAVYKELRAAGAVCVADEVQCGFGRAGSAYWAFSLQGVVPDVVTCGKPIGNGYPMAALVTTRQLADGFAAGGMEFFATYGGSTAAAAAGRAVLEVIREEGLQARAATVGDHTKRALRALQARHADVVGDVRGAGLMIGVELVTDAASRTHAPAVARFVKEHCKSAHRVLLSTEGPMGNVIKVKPPICFSVAEADRMIAAIAHALAALDEDANKKEALLEASRREVAAEAARRAAQRQ